MKSVAIFALLATAQACEPCACSYSSGGIAQKLSKQINLPSLPCGGGIGTLTSQLAGSATNIGAQNIVIPDKKSVTDQAKVSKTCSQSKKQDQNCAVSKRSFAVNGGIRITQKGENTLKSEASASQCGEEASQSQLRNNVKSNEAPASLP